MSKAIRETMHMAQEIGMDKTRLFEFRGCITEAAANVVKHANGGSITLHRIDDNLISIISDSGPGIGTMALPYLALPNVDFPPIYRFRKTTYGTKIFRDSSFADVRGQGINYKTFGRPNLCESVIGSGGSLSNRLQSVHKISLCKIASA